MSHFAQIDSDNIVTQVIVVDNSDCLDSAGNESEAVGIAFCQDLIGVDTNWVQTSYNDNIRFRYAGTGMKYDSANDVFYDEQSPYPSWALDTSTWTWEPPVAHPAAGFDDEGYEVHYFWDEDNLKWATLKYTSRLISEL